MEGSIWERLREEISRIFSSGYVWHNNAALFDAFTDEEVPAGNMFHPAEMFGVIGNIYGSFVITEYSHWFTAAFA